MYFQFESVIRVVQCNAGPCNLSPRLDHAGIDNTLKHMPTPSFPLRKTQYPILQSVILMKLAVKMEKHINPRSKISRAMNQDNNLLIEIENSLFLENL